MHRTVAELRATMSRVEFLSWLEFHKRNPIDPVGMHHRPAALVARAVAASTPGAQQVPPLQQYLEVLAPTPPEDEADNWFDSL